MPSCVLFSPKFEMECGLKRMKKLLSAKNELYKAAIQQQK